MRVALFALLLLSVLISTPAAQTVDRVPIPDGVFYYQPASTVFGAEAAWVNPAGLGRFNSPSAQVMADYFNDDFAQSWGWISGAEQMALGWRKLATMGGDLKEWLYAGALPVGHTNTIGFSYRYMPEGPGVYNKRHYWNIGLLSQGRGPLALGAVFSNLNRGKVAGERTEVEMRLSAGYRPSGEKFTFAVDAFLSSGMRFRNADFVYHAEFTPIRGLYINGLYDSDQNFQLGFRVNFTRSFFGSKSGFNKSGDHRGTTSFLGYSELRQPSIMRGSQRRLALGLSGALPENPPKPVFGKQRASFTEILASIYRAADDPSIKELVVTLHEASPGFARAQELRMAFEYFRSRGKRLICHANAPSNLAYYIGTAADSLFIPPVSQLNLVGLRAELTFYAGTMEKLGVKMDLVKIGDHKTATEPWTRSASSEENRAQVNRLLDELYDQFAADIARSRNLTIDSVKKVIDGGPYTSADALRSGLVDGLCYQDEIDSCIGKSRSIPFARYLKDTLVNYSWDRAPVLAIVVAQGDITSDQGDVNPLGSPGGVTPTPFRKAFAATRRDKDVAGVIFRIDSPGGSAMASDDIYHYSQRTAQTKPTVISMANVAASGGYYMAMTGKKVFALPGTITGSIGIYGGKADLSGLYQKLDLGKELYTRGKFAGMMSWVAPFSSEEREKYYGQLNAFYGHFLDLVSANRNLTVDSVDNLGRGRVWTGREASRNGLIDQVGGLKQSIDWLAATLGTKEYRIRVYPENRPLFILPARSLFGMMAGVLGTNISGEVERGKAALPESNGEIFARLPYDLTIE